MNSNTTLCLACSSSLPPRLLNKGPSASELFLTKCCSRPICPTCLARNPRLARYEPCLACLGGVRAVGSSKNAQDAPKNIDAAVRDEEVYTIGEDDDDQDEAVGASSSRSSEDTPAPATPPPAYSSELLADGSPDITINESHSAEQETDSTEKANEGAPSKYYIREGDTLLGIALRYGVDGRTLCKLNGLPPSTLSTTPHLMHTRTTLVLPPSSKAGSRSPSPALDPDMETRRARERARKRFQFVTKEVDWRVAQAYVALAEDEPCSSVSTSRADIKDARKEKTKTLNQDETVLPAERLEERAVDSYLDDAEWEERERRAGRDVRIEQLALAGGSSNGSRVKKSAGWSWRA